MTPERAKEVLRLGSQWYNWEEHCTEEEDRYVRKMWHSMPSDTCWHDALVRIARGYKPPIDRTLTEVRKEVQS
jgi:hypothetical protein